MIDESKIPLLEDLVSHGQVETQQTHLLADENQQIEIEPGDASSSVNAAPASGIKPKQDELEGDANLKELIIDEEIRMILDKHMDRAYEEIIRLLNHKIT